MNYKEFLEHIYLRHSGNVKLGLDRMLSILVAMDNPNLKLSGFHVAGTNGKGSTSAMLEALSISFNFKTGLNTSPHLVDYRERIRIDKKFIPFDELLKIYKKFENIFMQNEASFFEITTAIAFYYFYSHNVDISIFEVGLGGRLDGTNPFDSDIAIITTISYDHTKSLGDTLEKIAYEKAGIIKENKPVILGNISDKLVDVIEKIAKDKNAPIYRYGRNFTVSNIRTDMNGTIFDFSSDEYDFANIHLNLLGEHQAYNAAVAIYAFIKYLDAKGITFYPLKVYAALENISWRGRLQIIGKKPLTLIDGAHNEEGIISLVKNLKMIFPDRRIFFVMAILRDKNLDKIIEMIADVSYKIYISKNQSTRAAELDLQEKFVKLYHTNYIIIADVVDALEKALEDANDNDIVMVSGSLYTISEVLKKVY